MKRNTSAGVTLIELVVVLLILSLLSTIAVGVYTSSVRRAQFTVARTEIRQLELAASRYEVDLGVFPPSSSGTNIAPLAANPTGTVRFGQPADPINGLNGITNGCGYLTLCLTRSMSGDPLAPADPNWHGPYMELQVNKLGAINLTANQTLDDPLVIPTAGAAAPQICLLDPWGNPYFYVRSVQPVASDTFPANPGYVSFNAAREPVGSPFAGQFFNPTTFQIFSLGPDGDTDENNPGRGVDDINNFDNTP